MEKLKTESNPLCKYLNVLNSKLKEQEIKVELCIFDEVLMYLVFNTRESTYDIDAIFELNIKIRDLILDITKAEGLSDEWLEVGVKGFISDNNDIVVYKKLSNLVIKTVKPEYLFTMKCLSCRIQNATEMRDIKFLFRYLKLKNVKEALDIIYKYYDKKRFNQRLYYVLQEISDSLEFDYLNF